ncbi:MAG TPA: hypothetical protein PK637_03335, partial [Flavobacteriales bacterium]|nr:hypothetical protein [Flavobacteriales bacterium]
KGDLCCGVGRLADANQNFHVFVFCWGAKIGIIDFEETKKSRGCSFKKPYIFDTKDSWFILIINR